MNWLIRTLFSLGCVASEQLLWNEFFRKHCFGGEHEICFVFQMLRKISILNAWWKHQIIICFLFQYFFFLWFHIICIQLHIYIYLKFTQTLSLCNFRTWAKIGDLPIHHPRYPTLSWRYRGDVAAISIQI